ncbi:MAG: hypothetical protein K0R26_2427 [Bacteroidota bacterium]|jgi:hypothetical protein|nr:hypothetical protein [Bacteroidota bacterium]
MYKVKHFIIYICIASGLFSFAQEKAPDLPRFSLRMNIGIPKITSSEQYRHSFSGVVTADGSINYKLFSNFNVGLGYNYTYFKCQKYFRDPLRDNINTILQVQNGYLKLGYDHFFSDNGFAVFAVNMGAGQGKYGSVRYKHDSLMGKTPVEFSNAFIEPLIGLYFIVDPNFAIGAHVSYNYSFTKFDPLYPQFHQWGPEGYTKISNKWNMSMITLGFGFYYGIGKTQ